MCSDNFLLSSVSAGGEKRVKKNDKCKHLQIKMRKTLKPNILRKLKKLHQSLDK